MINEWPSVAERFCALVFFFFGFLFSGFPLFAVFFLFRFRPMKFMVIFMFIFARSAVGDQGK